MPRDFVTDSVRGNYAFVDIIPIDVSVSDYELSPPDPVSFRGFSIGTAGDITITTLTGKVRTIPANCLAVGVFHPIAGKKVHNSGTTATEICLGI